MNDERFYFFSLLEKNVVQNVRFFLLVVSFDILQSDPHKIYSQ